MFSFVAQGFRMSPCLGARRVPHFYNGKNYMIMLYHSSTLRHQEEHRRCFGRMLSLRIGGVVRASSEETVGGTTQRLPPVKRITRDDVTIQFARSSGAGGQNVNKVNTKVDMRLHLGNATWLHSDIADAVRRMEKKRINKDDELVIMSQRTRSQLGNIEDALEKMQEILDHAHQTTLPIEEDPEKKKQIDAQLKKGNETRLKKKQLKGDKKKERRSGKNIKDW